MLDLLLLGLNLGGALHAVKLGLINHDGLALLALLGLLPDFPQLVLGECHCTSSVGLLRVAYKSVMSFQLL